MDTIRGSRSGRHDSTGKFTLDKEAMERKTALDKDKQRALELQEFQSLRTLPATHDNLRDDRKYKLWRKYKIRIAYKLAWRWGILVTLLALTGYFILNRFSALEGIKIFGMNAPRQILDPVLIGLFTALFTLTTEFSKICDKKYSGNVPWIIVPTFSALLVALIYHFEAGADSSGLVTIISPTYLECITSIYFFFLLPAFGMSIILMIWSGDKVDPITEFVTRQYNNFISWITVEDL